MNKNNSAMKVMLLANVLNKHTRDYYTLKNVTEFLCSVVDNLIERSPLHMLGDIYLMLQW